MKRILIIVILFTLVIVSKAQTTHVTLTYYQPVKEQCNSEPLVTADGSKINLHHLKQGKIKWCAISRDLLWLFPKNRPKRIYIDGFGIYQVRDIMNKRWNHRVDILIHPKDINIYNDLTTKFIKLEKVKIKILK